MKDKNILVMLGSVLAAIVILGIILVALFNQGITDLTNMIFNHSSATSSQISIMMLDIENMLDNQNSLIAGYTIIYDKPDAKKLTCDVTVSVTPKTYSADTTAELFIGSSKTAMTRNGNAYEATISFPITQSGDVSVSFEKGGIIQTEVLPEGVDIGERLFNGLIVEQMGDFYYQNNTMFLSGTVMYSFNSIITDTIESAQLIAMENGKEMWSKDIDYPQKLVSDEYVSYEISLDDTISNVPNVEAVSVYIEIKCASGLIYRSDVIGNKDTDMSGVYDTSGNKIDFN